MREQHPPDAQSAETRTRTVARARDSPHLAHTTVRSACHSRWDEPPDPPVTRDPIPQPAPGCGLRAAGCGLRAASCELRAAGCGLRAAGCGLRAAGCELRAAGCGLRIDDPATCTASPSCPARTVPWCRHASASVAGQQAGSSGRDHVSTSVRQYVSTALLARERAGPAERSTAAPCASSTSVPESSAATSRAAPLHRRSARQRQSSVPSRALVAPSIHGSTACSRPRLRPLPRQREGLVQGDPGRGLAMSQHAARS